MDYNNVPKEFEDNLEKIVEMFEIAYNNALKGKRAKTRERVIKYAPELFKRWYYSVMLAETPLSPANIVDGLKRQFKVDPFLSPQLRIVSDGKKDRFKLELVRYSLENHPIVADAARVLESCFPVVNLNRDYLPEDYSVIDELTIKSRTYAEYLIRLLIKTKMLVKVPSIGVVSYRPSVRVNEFFDDEEEAFQQLYYAAVGVFIDDLNEMIPVGGGFSREVEELLEDHHTLDDIFADFLSIFGMSVEEAASFDFEDFVFPDFDEDGMNFDDAEIKQAFVASAFFLGISVDKYFLTPFSNYFQFIVPLHAYVLDLNNEVEELAEALSEEDELDFTLFSPCSQYFLSEFGKMRSLKLKNQEYELYSGAFLASGADGSMADLVDMLHVMISRGAQIPHFFTPSADREFDVCALKIKTATDKRFWQTMEVNMEMTVIQLHGYICMAFDLDIGCDFSFFTTPDLTSDRGTRGHSLFNDDKVRVLDVSGKNSKKRDKPQFPSLNALNLTKGQKLTYIVYDTYPPFNNAEIIADVEFEIEVLNIFTSKEESRYPRSAKISKQVRDWYEHNQT